MTVEPGQSVLVVEDDVFVQELLRVGLADAGFRLELAGNEQQAVAALEAHRAQPLAGLVTDVNLGRGRTGWDIAQLAREFNPHLPVVYVSGDSAHAWAARGVPRSTMIPKPFVPAQIVMSAVQKAAQRDLDDIAAERDVIFARPRHTDRVGVDLLVGGRP